MRGELVSATAVPGLDDEAAEDPEDDELPPGAIEDLVPVVPHKAVAEVSE